ncbi:hypothetical protein [Tsukamurella soli]|uniref:DNA double-strand break repair nuclease NurA n=1 Tax=Tsukamurella soli TaxID=644556 RepID=A0ABP8J6H4_9ACTN
MPYPNERAPRLGHVPTVSSKAVQDAFSRWEIAQARPDDENRITDLCVSVDSLPTRIQASDVRFSITVDGSETEVEATREHPTIKVGYIRVAGSLLEIGKLDEAGKGPFVDPRLVSEAHHAAAFDAALPGSGLVQHGFSGVDTWRREMDRFLRETRYDADSDLTLADALLTLHGGPGVQAPGIVLRTCPSRTHDYPSGNGPLVGKDGATCPSCAEPLYLADVLRTHEEYSEEGSNQGPITRAMNVAERLMTLSYLDTFYVHADRPLDAFRDTIFITDGPLALFGVVAPLKRRFQEYLDKLFTWSDGLGTDLPLLVGVEKTGRFVEHAELIRDIIPEGHVMRLTTEYINRITGRPAGNRYGTDEFYGRRFIYRTTTGDPLVITVPPKAGVLPYEGTAAEDFASYPTLRAICEVLDGVRTRLYPNAVIPVALAHSSAALPLGVGQSVLRALAQKGVGLPENSQIRTRPQYR